MNTKKLSQKIITQFLVPMTLLIFVMPTRADAGLDAKVKAEESKKALKKAAEANNMAAWAISLFEEATTQGTLSSVAEKAILEKLGDKAPDLAERTKKIFPLLAEIEKRYQTLTTEQNFKLQVMEIEIFLRNEDLFIRDLALLPEFLQKLVNQCKNYEDEWKIIQEVQARAPKTETTSVQGPAIEFTTHLKLLKYLTYFIDFSKTQNLTTQKTLIDLANEDGRYPLTLKAISKD